MRRRRTVFALLAILLSLVSFGCFTTGMSVQVVRGEEEGDEPLVYVEASQFLDQAYIRAAHQANLDMRADYAKANKAFDPELEFPETMDAFTEEFGTAAFDPKDLEKQGFTKSRENAAGWAYRKKFTLSELMKAGEASRTPGAADPIRVERDKATGITRYIFELDVPVEEEKFDWKEWDDLKKTVLPKPSLETTDGKVELKVSPEAEKALEFSGIGGALKGVLEAFGGAAEGAELRGWYGLGILRGTGLPAFVIEVELPGEIVKHELNGQPTGEVKDFQKAIFTFDEAFLRKYGFGGYAIRVESLVEPVQGGKDTEKEDDQQKQDDGKDGEGPKKFWKFRIRAHKSRGLAIGVGYSQMHYELQEINSDGTPGRWCMMKFSGVGLGVSLKGLNILPFGGGFAPIAADWTEFETKKGMRLEDFHGINGTHSSLGALVGGWAGMTFGTKKSGWEQQARTHSLDWFVGAHGGLDLFFGKWEIVEGPED
jgi:hypothetical protein